MFTRIRISLIVGALLVLFSSVIMANTLLDIPVGISPVMSSAAMFIAKERGYFKDQGLNVVINPFKASGAKMVPFLATGQLFVGGGNVNAGMYNAIANDIPIKIVADKGTVSPGHGYLALMVRNDHVEGGRYKDYADLKGMTMAVTAKGVSQQIATERYLNKVGLSLKDIRLVYLGYGDMNIAMANKSIDATIQIEPLVAAAVEKNIAVRVAGADEIYPNQQSAVIMYSPVFIEKHPSKAKKFMVAYVKGLRDYNDAFTKGKGKSEIIAILTKYTRINEDSMYEKVVPVGLNPNGLVNIESLQHDANWYLQKGFIKKLPEINIIVDLSFVKYARSVLGEYK